MLFVYFSTLLESILKSGLLESALLAGKNWVGIVGVGIVGVGIIAPTLSDKLKKLQNPAPYGPGRFRDSKSVICPSILVVPE